MKKPFLPRIIVITIAALTLTGCVQNSQAVPGAAQLTVNSSAEACTVSASSVPSGTVSFSITNSSDQVTEFYLLANDGLRIVGEMENIGPGLTRDLVVQAQPGNYFTICKPGMVGEGIGRTAFTVTGDPVIVNDDMNAQITHATNNYVSYIKDQIGQLVVGTSTFVDTYRAGDDEKARSLYATTRAHYERVEPVAESFGDLDPQLDFRESDVSEPDTWTGWHRIEKDLWPPTTIDNNGIEYHPLTRDERSYYGNKLIEDTQQLYDAVHAENYTVTIDAISNGAVALMDEVASGKITGEEEIWSHTDLWDFQANLDGARVAYDGVRAIIENTDPELVKTLDKEFNTLQSELAQYGNLIDGFPFYGELTAEDVKQLADYVNALSEPLSTLTATLLAS
jgi:iron uptake system component EfeO